jgi:hypothetical protein
MREAPLEDATAGLLTEGMTGAEPDGPRTGVVVGRFVKVEVYGQTVV